MSVTLQNGLLRRKKIIVGEFNILAPTLNILVVNLMPNRLQTEKQFVAHLASQRINIRLTFAVPTAHKVKHESNLIKGHYVTLDDIWQEYFDGLIVTGAPVDQVPFESIDYWSEFQKLLFWRQSHVSESLFTCWAAYGAGYVEKNFPVESVAHKIFGVYQASVASDNQHPALVQNIDQLIMPHSRYFTIPDDNVSKNLRIAGNNQVGTVLLRDAARHSTYTTGHLEYDTNTLQTEYYRDIQPGILPQKPENYDSFGQPNNTWHVSAKSFFGNWTKLLLMQKHLPETVDYITALG